MRGAVWVVFAVHTAAVASQACRLGELTFSAVQVQSLINHDVDEDLNSTTPVEVTACRYEQSTFVARHETVYYNVYYWSRVIFIHVIPCCALVLFNTSLIFIHVIPCCALVYYWSRVIFIHVIPCCALVLLNTSLIFIHVIPCCALVILNTSLIRAMRTARQRRRQMSQSTTTLASNRTMFTVTETQYEMQPLVMISSNAPANTDPRPPPRRHCGQTGDSSTRATMMLIIVVGVFLLVEVPLSGRPRRRSRRGSAAVCPAAARHR